MSSISFPAGGAPVVGWDVGGAHVKASLLVDGRLKDVAQWPAPLWRGLAHLEPVLHAARCRWPEFGAARHGVTMTAEMTDLFPDREAGVLALATWLACRLGESTRFFAGPRDWPAQAGAAARWRDLASANWLATAHLAAAAHPEGILADIGSTTTDLIPIRAGRPVPRGRSDAERLAGGELVYLGVSRTPLCALAKRMEFGGRRYNVMNELFATSADVFRLTGELAADHDQQPTADGAGKDEAATCRRLARMIGMDARDAEPAAWRDFANRWRAALVGEIACHLDRVAEDAGLPAAAPVVGAGCGIFVARELAARCGRPFVPFHTLAGPAPRQPAWADTCAPSVAVAMLLARWNGALPELTASAALQEASSCG